MESGPGRLNAVPSVATLSNVRVLHVLGTAEVAGTGISAMVRLLAAQLDPAEFQLSACFLGTGGPWVERLAAAGIATKTVPWSTPWDVAGAARFWRHLRGQQVSLVHLHFGGRSIRRLARLATGARLVVHVHGRVRSEDDYRPVPVLLPDADVVIATSRAVADWVKAPTVEVVYPGVPADDRVAIRDPWLIGAAGRLVPIKGYDRLIEAFALVRARQPQARLEIAGDGPERVSLEGQVRRLALGDSVRFAGWADDLSPLMSRWSLFVQPSFEEAFGITVLQAMSAGLPVVASNVGGLPELVTDGVTGMLVTPGDAGSLATAVDDMLREPHRLAALGANARRHSVAFSEAAFAAGVSAIYRRALRSTRR
jgi:glycosyltransferase involved in cell wall biosynthesis